MDTDFIVQVRGINLCVNTHFWVYFDVYAWFSKLNCPTLGERLERNSYRPSGIISFRA